MYDLQCMTTDFIVIDQICEFLRGRGHVRERVDFRKGVRVLEVDGPHRAVLNGMMNNYAHMA